MWGSFAYGFAVKPEMFEKNLRVHVAHRLYLWLLAASVGVGISSLILSMNSHLLSVVKLPQGNRAEKVSPFTDMQAGFRVAFKTIDNLDSKQRRHYQPPSDFQGLTINGVQLPPDQKAIALTFDDGPWPQTTAKMLDILNAYEVKATFFVLGRNITRFPHLLKRVAQEGHAIGNHTWSHNYHYHHPGAAQREIQRTAQIIEKYTGFTTKLFRPPGGYLRNGLVAHARAQKHVTLMWTVDDTYKGTVDQVVNNVVQKASSGGIVLMHDGGGDRKLMLEALPIIITHLKQQGYQLVTIPQLLEMANAHQQAG